MVKLARDEFRQPIKGALAQRVSYVCSNPDCRANTTGPSASDTQKVVNVGVAAHITAAAPGGPRYDEQLIPAERESASNGIWLCQTCSALIDRNNGIDYPVTILQKWKADSEAEAERKIGKTATAPLSEIAGTIQATGIGEVTGAEITKPTRIAAGTHISVFGIGKITGVRN